MKKLLTLTGALLLASFGFTHAQIRLPKLINDGMILQQGAPIKLWGWASANEKITVEFLNQKKTTKADAQGNWNIEFPSAQYDGKSHTMVLKGKNTISLKNILLGEVWFCSGQSNMVHQLYLHDVTYAEELKNVNFPEIRQFWVPNVTNLKESQTELPSGEWVEAVDKKVLPFSAVAYFFAKQIHQKYKVPVGIINSSWGGSPIEAWISEEGFKGNQEILALINKQKDTAYVNQIDRTAKEANKPQPTRDLGLLSSPKWFENNYKTQNWKTINIPGYWEDQGIRDLNGVVWYKKEIDIDARFLNKETKIFLGRIVDADEVYINGTKIGQTTYMYPQRRYNIPTNLLKQGKNTITIRVSNFGGKGGFVPDKPYYLATSSDTLSLRGEWHYKVGEVFEPKAPSPQPLARQNQPAALYNSMVHPIINYPIKGVLWYQGESNTGKPKEYTEHLERLISDWRKRWQNPTLPVIYAQLPGFMEYNYLPTESNWALHREAMVKALKIPNTALTVNIDLGEWNDIHPENKKSVGDRFAIAAQHLAYGENVIYSGPMYKSHKVEGNKIILEFEHIGSGLTTTDGENPQEFAIAGSDKKFKWAKTKIEGNRIIVWNDDISTPQFVRYAWADNPVNPNLANKEGLMASPFRTDF